MRQETRRKNKTPNNTHLMVKRKTDRKPAQEFDMFRHKLQKTKIKEKQKKKT